jgi:hypothetical protein
MVKLRDAIQNYHLGSMLNVPNPEAQRYNDGKK